MIEKVKDYPNYSINDLGEVFNNKTGRKLKQIIKKGYCGVFLYNKDGRKSFLVHRLVAKTFIPNPNNYPEINHKDENPLNNKVENLEWCTSKYNANYGNHNKRLSESLRKTNAWKGRNHTEKSKQKMRVAKLGITLTEEHKKKISMSNQGKGRIGNSVYCVELNKSFKSALEAERQTGIPNPNIIQVCLEKRKTAGGYHWQYENKKENK